MSIRQLAVIFEVTPNEIRRRLEGALALPDDLGDPNHYLFNLAREW